MKENILVVFGGQSVEHEISIITALQAIKNYKGKYNLLPIYLARDNYFYFLKELDLSNFKNFNHTKKDIVTFQANKDYIKYKSKKLFFSAVYLIVHGKNCEDGTLFSFFKTLNINCIGMNPYQGIICQDKFFTKKIANVKQLPYIKITKEIIRNNISDLLTELQKMSFPIILKPTKLGSSIGVLKVNNTDEFIENISSLFAYDDTILAEPFLEEIEEYNIAVIKYSNNYYYSEIEKIVNNKILSYNDKYVNETKSMNSINKELPAIIDKKLQDLIVQTALNAYKNLNARYCCRLDFIYDKKNKELYFNELNNIPGSLAYYLFSNCNISISKLIDMIIDEGLYDIDQQKNEIKLFKDNLFQKINTENIKLSK